MAEKLTKDFLFSGFGIDQLFWSSIKLGSLIAFGKKGKMNFWPQRQYRWDRKNKSEGSGPADGRLRSNQALQVRQRWPQNHPYANSCPVDLFSPMSLVPLPPKFPPDLHTQVSKSVRLLLFTMDWKVCLWAIPRHLMCVLCGLLWGTVMGGLHEQGAAFAETALA